MFKCTNLILNSDMDQDTKARQIRAYTYTYLRCFGCHENDGNAYLLFI